MKNICRINNIKLQCMEIFVVLLISLKKRINDDTIIGKVTEISEQISSAWQWKRKQADVIIREKELREITTNGTDER